MPLTYRTLGSQYLVAAYSTLFPITGSLGTVTASSVVINLPSTNYTYTITRTPVLGGPAAVLTGITGPTYTDNSNNAGLVGSTGYTYTAVGSNAYTTTRSITLGSITTLVAITAFTTPTATSSTAGVVVLNWTGGTGSGVTYTYTVYKNASATPLAASNYSTSAATSTSVTFTFTDNTVNSYTFTVTATAGASTLTSALSTAVTSASADVTGWTISLDLNTSTLPTTDAGGTTVTKYGSPTMYNDATRGYVLYSSSAPANGSGLRVNFSLQSSYTITCWLKCDNSTGGNVIWQLDNVGTAAASLLYLQANLPGPKAFYGNGSISESANAVSVGTTWNMCTVIYNYSNTTMYFYLNGSVVSGQTSTGQSGFSSAVASGVNIGGLSNTSFYMSNFRIYPFALSSTQVSNLYNYQLR